jgi:16S rRNA processing protein RimM
LKSEHRQGLYAAGKIVKVFGIKGEVKVYSYARTSDEYESLETVKVGPNDTATSERIIDAARDRGGDVYVKFRGIDDRNAAEEIVNHFIYIEEERRKPPQAGRYYVHDLIGCRVSTVEGRELGTLKDVMNAPGGTLYVVATTHGDVLMPAVKEFIAAVNIASKLVTVTPPEGLFEGEAL